MKKRLLNILSIYTSTFKGLSKDIWAVATIYLINRTGEMVLPFMSLYLINQLGFSMTQSAIVLSSFGAGALVGSNLGGYLTDRLGNFKVMLISLIGSGIGYNMILAFDSFIPLCCWMILTAIFTSMFSPAAFGAVGKWGNPKFQTRGYSLLRMAINLGIAIGGYIGGHLAEFVGYHWLFIIDGATCFIAAGALFIVLNHRNTSEIISREVAQTGRSPYKDKHLMTFLFLNLLNMVVFFQIIFSVPVYFKDVLGLEEKLIGTFFMANGIMVLLLEMPVIFRIEQSGKLFKPIAVGALLVGAGYASLHLTNLPMIAIILFSVLVAIGEVVNFPLIPSIAMRRAAEHNQGQYMGVVSTMFAMAFLLAPISGLPLIEKIGWEPYWTIAMTLSLISFVGLTILFRIKKTEYL